MILDKIAKKRNKERRKRFGPCPECEERAVRDQLHWFWGPMGTYQCDACGETWDEFEDTRSIMEAKRESPDVWDGEAADVELRDEARRFPLLSDAARDAKEAADDVEDKTAPDVELTDHQKSKKHLSSVCFALGILFSLTIIGIPVGVLFLILAAWLTPEPYQETAQEDSDQ